MPAVMFVPETVKFAGLDAVPEVVVNAPDMVPPVIVGVAIATAVTLFPDAAVVTFAVVAPLLVRTMLCKL